MLLCEENKCVPTEHEVATGLRYVRTICFACGVEFEVLLVPGVEFFPYDLFPIKQYLLEEVQSPGPEVH